MTRRRSFRDAVVLITGASSGIGRATALAFAAKGARLVLASRSHQALVEVERDCRASGGQVLVVPTDIADPAAVDRLARLAVRRFGQIDVWVEAVAVGVAGPLGSESVDELRRLVDTRAPCDRTGRTSTCCSHPRHRGPLQQSSLCDVRANPDP